MAKGKGEMFSQILVPNVTKQRKYTRSILQHHHHHHHHHLPPWIRSFDLYRLRRIAIVSWGVHDLFFLEVCS